MSIRAPRVSLRLKIIFLILMALAASLASYLHVGTNLIISDKTSYIYDFTLSEVTAVSERLTALRRSDQNSHVGENELRGNPQMSIAVFGSNGALVASRNAEATPPDALERVRLEISGSEFSSGARAWHDGESEYLVAYNRLPGAGMVVIGWVPQTIAFSAADSLVKRSVFLGLSIFLIVAGIALLAVRGITAQLRSIWNATQLVRDGTFTIRVPESSSRDEIADLSRSFNAMAARIEELMLETAQKARMEKELETAQQVQRTLFPREDFEHPSLQVSGRTIPATECAGDWWNYRQVGSKVVVVIGDVMGHGVSAALVTAAAHGAFSLLVREFSNRRTTPDLARILCDMNAAVCAASGGSSTMSLLVTMLDLENGELEYINAAHRPIYLERCGTILPLMEASAPALGGSDEIMIPTLAKKSLEPGDTLLWFTDGLVECPNNEGRTLSTARIAKLLARLSATLPDAAPLCRSIVEESVAFMGKAFDGRPDDISVIVGKIPGTAKFKKALNDTAA